MARRFITKVDIDELLTSGRRTLEVDGATIVTDLAAEYARGRGVSICRSESSAPPAPPGSGANADHATVRSAVIAALGTVPPNLDDTIERVLGER